jgi:hypothetical protein
VDLDDSELVQQLTVRDGAVGYRRHVRPDEVCPYAELYEGKTCPWCEAEERRREREAGAAPS